METATREAVFGLEIVSQLVALSLAPSSPLCCPSSLPRGPSRAHSSSGSPAVTSWILHSKILAPRRVRQGPRQSQPCPLCQQLGFIKTQPSLHLPGLWNEFRFLFFLENSKSLFNTTYHFPRIPTRAVWPLLLSVPSRDSAVLSTWRAGELWFHTCPGDLLSLAQWALQKCLSHEEGL